MDQEQLNHIREEINTQDNRITADPLFCVFEKERIYGMDPDYCDDFDWYDPEDHETRYGADEISKEEAESRGYKQCYWIERDRFVNAHFTEKAANHHIKINGHNLTRPFTYVTSMRRCFEMIAIRDALKDGKLVIKR